MTSNKTILILTFGTLIAASSCARKEPPVVVEHQQPGAAPSAAAAPAPAPEPVRESAWRPIPVRSAPPKSAPLPNPSSAANQPPPELASPPPVATSAPATNQIPAPVQSKTVLPPPAPMKVTLAAGSTLPVRVGESLSSEKNENGDSWSGVLAEPLVIDGLVIAERGSRVEGRVTDVKRAGRVKGVANLTVTLTRFNTADGQRIEVNTSSFSRAGADETKKDVGKVAIASGIGAAIGAIAGRGKGAAIGAGAGAGAGTGVVLATRGGPAVIANETLIRFRVADSVTITEKLR